MRKPSHDSVVLPRGSPLENAAAGLLPAPVAAPQLLPEVLTDVLKIQRDLAIELLRCEGLQQCLEVLLEAAMRLPGFDCGGVYVCDQTDGGLQLTAHRGLSEAFVARVTRHWKDSPQSQMVNAGMLIYAPRSELPPAVAQSLINEGLEAIAVLPLRVNGRIIASLNVSSHCHLRIQPESRVALESITALAEGTLELLRLRAAGQAADRQLRLAVTGADLGTWVADFDSGNLEASPRARELHGIGPEVVLTVDNALAAIHPDDLEAFLAEVRRAINDGSSFACEYRSEDGSRWIASTARFYGDHGRQFYGIVQDVTVRRQAKQAQRDARDQLESRVAQRTAELAAANAALREESARLKMALDASQAGTWAMDFSVGDQHWDSRSREIFGIPDGIELDFEEWLRQRVHPDDRDHFLSRMEETVTAGHESNWNHEFRILHPTLGERWILGLGEISRDEAGRACRVAGLNLDITERKLAEQVLHQSEARYRALHQSMHEAFVRTDMAGRILESNRAYQEMLGYTPEELKRLTFVDITPTRWHAWEARLVAEQILQQDYSEVYEKEYVCKDGTVLPVELRTFLIRDAAGQPDSMWAIVRDLTDRKATEEITRLWNQTLEQRLGERAQQLIQSEARFRQLAEATYEGISINDGSVLLDGNAQLAAMFGYELSEIIGRPLLDFVAPESLAKVTTVLGAGSESPYEWIGVRKDGSTFPVESNPRIRTWQGRPVRMAAVRDLTQIKQATARLNAQQAELEQAQRLALISEISAGIIHQISQPLCSVGANLAVATANVGRCGHQSCQSKEILDEIGADVARMREIVTHLRSLSNPEQPNRLRIDFNAVVADVLPLLYREAGARQVRLEAAMAPDLPLLLADAVQLKQVVLNLVRNGFDACADLPPRRRVVSVATRMLPNRDIELTVRDAGTGIDPADEDRLFNLFFTTKQEGRGVGLRLCRTIVSAHDGSIEAGNNPDGIGAVFRVLLPVDFTGPIPKYNYPSEPGADKNPS